MKKFFVLISAVSLFGAASCKKEASPVADKTNIQFTLKQAKILESSNKFGINLFKDLADNLPDNNNLFVSPLSVYLALTMTYNGAANQTAADMQNTLGFQGLTKEDINQSCKELVNVILHADPLVTMEIANSIWYRNEFSVKPDFLDINQNYFDAQVTPCDFTDASTVSLINNWVKTKTHDKIENVINDIPSDAVMYLINAIYFKGTWKYTFNKNKTTLKPFHSTPTNTVDVPFMEQTGTLKYMENDLLQAIEFPYGNNGFSMIVLLPKSGKTVNDLVSNFSESTWQSWNNAMDSTNLTVYMPRFKFSYDTLLNESLKALGMSKAFSEMDADFSNINETIRLYISKVLHKSFVEVNEDGTEAAAVTVVEISFTSIGEGDNTKYFNANKPFIFAIKENTKNTILFAGLINKPASE